MGNINSDLNTKNKTSNGHVMCFIFTFMMITNNNYTRPRYNVGFRCFVAAPFANS